MANGTGGRSADRVESLRARLRDAIVSGSLPQGATLSQVQLAEQFGVSRTPLREALRMLQSEGFIDSQPNQRVRVSQVSVAELEQLYCMRLALESLAVRIAVPRMTSDDLAELRRLLNLMDEFRAAGDLSAWHGPHKEFHRRLVRHAGESISEVVGGLQARSDRYQHMYVSSGPLTWAATAPEHAAIAAACEHGDAASAANELARHLARTALTGVAVMAPEHDPHAIRDALSQAMISTTAPPRSNKS